MAPPCLSFPAAELPLAAQRLADGRRRRLDAAGLDLAACELLRLVQYKCSVPRPQSRDCPVRCLAFERLFRRCKDRKSTFMVETTAWERRGGPQPRRAEPSPAEPHQWSRSWHDADEAPR